MLFYTRVKRKSWWKNTGTAPKLIALLQNIALNLMTLPPVQKMIKKIEKCQAVF
jgi:hypothetical protein